MSIEATGAAERNTKSALHLAALKRVADGWLVFPCIPKGKRPATANGFKDRTLDPAQIEAWWEANPDYNIGIVPADRDQTVIDLDGSAGAENWAVEYGDAPPTYTVTTPSGGKHLYFKGVLDTNGKLAPGIDIRSTRGYVLVPPSVVEYPDGTVATYEFANNTAPAPLPDAIPAAVAANVKVERKPADAPEHVELDDPETIEWAKEVLAADLAEHGEPIDGNGSDARTHAIIGTLRDGPRWGKSLSDGTIADLLHECWAPHFDYEWIKGKVANGSWQNEKGCAPARSDERRYGPPEKWGKWLDEQGIKRNTCSDTAESTTTEKPKWPTIKTIWDIRHTYYKAVRWVWHERLLANEPNLYTGDGGAGKTTLAENLSVAVSAGIPLLGADTMQMPVFLLVAEDRYGQVRDNILAIRRALGAPEETLKDIHVLSVKSDRVEGGHVLARIDENGIVTSTPSRRSASTRT
jgi:hypothetical protein